MNNIAVNFSHLNLPPDTKSSFKGQVIEVMREKYKGTNSRIFEDGDTASRIGENEQVQTIFIHNNKSLDQYPEEGLGTARPENDLAEVNINDVTQLNRGAIDYESLASQTGTVASHEAFHLFGPIGHSIESEPNLMSEGHVTSESLMNNNGIGLEFTYFQKEILRSEVNFGSLTLTDVERSMLPEDMVASESEEGGSDLFEDLDLDDFLG